MNVKVAVRVRPFNDRERALGSDCCLKMTGNQTTLLKDGNEGLERTFTFDHCLWSHEGFYEKDDGTLVANSDSQYCDQDKLFKEVGQDLLNNALKGYNCCLFAYGQTGSGKSYSIFGYEGNPGLVPRLCENLFEQDSLRQNAKKSFSLNFSMLEIYNERVQDLLIPISQRSRAGLKIRENATLGVFVEGLTRREVANYETIEELISCGNKNKTLGSTLMNSTSSRAHTIITFDLIQRTVTEAGTTQLRSQVYLVDLAGSEKVSKTEAKGDRLREACSINKSLTMLGKVINQLCRRSKGEKIIISYRDAVLTRILQNSLGGNSVTCMICALSPARDNYEETLSTLRYADQAKQIKQNAKINESESDKLIKLLILENERLKAIVAQLESHPDSKSLEDVGGQIREIEQVLTRQNAMESETYSHQNTEHQSTIKLQKSQLKGAHIFNLNEDPLLEGKIVFNLEEVPVVRVTREKDQSKETNMEAIIQLNGIGIIEDHAKIYKEDEDVWILIEKQEAGHNTFLNGVSLSFNKEELTVSRRLNDLDRLIFGTSSTFLVKIPNESTSSKKLPRINWEYCQLEKFRQQEKIERNKVQQEFEEQEKKLKEQETMLREKFEKEKLIFQQKIDNQKAEYEESLEAAHKALADKTLIEDLEDDLSGFEVIRSLQTDQKSKEMEFQLKVNALQKESQQLKTMQCVNEELESKLINYYHKIKEANYIAQELGRNIEFVPFVASLNLLASIGGVGASADLVVKVKVLNFEEGWANYWDLEKFDSRLVLIREALEYFFTYNLLNYSQIGDPFWDPEEFFLIGQSFCLAKNILYRFSMEHKVGILGYDGELGYMIITLMPIDDLGLPISEEEAEEEVEEPDDLLEKNLSCHFKVEISYVVFYDISKLKGKKGYFDYEVLTSDGSETFTTKIFSINDNQVEVNYSQWIKIPKVTSDIIAFYLHKNLHLRLYTEQLEIVPRKGPLPSPIITHTEKKTSFKNSNLYQSVLIDKTSPKKENNIHEKPSSKPNAHICSIM